MAKAKKVEYDWGYVFVGYRCENALIPKVEKMNELLGITEGEHIHMRFIEQPEFPEGRNYEVVRKVANALFYDFRREYYFDGKEFILL